MGDKGNKKDKTQNIQVFARLRPINQREKEIKSVGVIEVSGPKEVVVRNSLQSNITKKFYFDKAFGPQSKQVEVYQEVVNPLIEEVLSGYNCTVFAYGQTGTGKTHTMVGENSSNEVSWQNNPMAGIIPRALNQLFDDLRLTNNEYAVRVSYLELYNEELFDLLANSEDNSKLRIYEDATKKGVNIVSGLEEIAVYSKSEVFKIMEKGQERRKMAATLMNAQSSRSHTVFTIVVHVKENSSEGEELIKVGKLNLVDLAGSENISKAGSDNSSKKERARECLTINQSLLTLGRVITALVERHPHIPYRESKLTRLLQESLGGRTKTSIIATISPGHKDLEETLSTLEYAYRAKSIQNKPEVNQKMTKRAVLKEYTDEIDRLKRELHATREKNGVYLDNKTYSDILSKQQDQEKDLQDKIVAIRVMQEEKLKQEEVYRQLEEQFKDKVEQLEETSRDLCSTKNELNVTKTQLTETQNVVEEQQHLVAKRAETEETLSSQAKSLLAVADKATNHVECLQNTVAKRSTLEQNNLNTTMKYTAACSERRAEMKSYVDNVTEEMRQRMAKLQSQMGDQHSEYIRHQTDHKSQIDSIVEQMKAAIIQMGEEQQKNDRKVLEFTEESKELIKRNVKDQRMKVEVSLLDFLDRLSGEVEGARVKERKILDDMFSYMDQVCSAYKSELCGLREAQLHWNSTMEQRLLEMRDKHSNNVKKHLEEKAELLALYEDDRREWEEYIAALENELMDLKAQQSSWTGKMVERIKEKEGLLLSNADAFYQLADEGMSRLSEMREDVASRTLKLLDNQNCLVESVRDRVEKSHVATFSCLQEVQCDVQNEVSSSIEESKTSAAEFVKVTQGTLDGMLTSHKQLTKETIDGINTLTSTSEQCLQQLSANSRNEMEQQSEQHRNLVQSLTESTASVQEFHSKLDKEISRHDDLHSRFVEKEYGVYSPTGKTPMKQEYKYPKMLVSTSPHERIIKRFRALRGYKNDDDNELNEVIEIKDDSDSPDRSSVSVANPEVSVCSLPSDGESVFLEPRRPPSARSTPIGIYRASSENDLLKSSTGKKIGKDKLISAEKSFTKAKKRRT